MPLGRRLSTRPQASVQVMILPFPFVALVLALERFSLKFAVLLEKNFNLAFGIIQLFPTGRGKLHAFLEKLQRTFQWNFALFQLSNNIFETLNTLFKFWQGGYLLREVYT